ncbi:MAG: hypothetical protein M0Q91_16255 [Methanoregula sp.]|jgi:hypothetical protein|nr:hypothetical protein [Methanoregula sp.]
MLSKEDRDEIASIVRDELLKIIGSPDQDRIHVHFYQNDNKTIDEKYLKPYRDYLKEIGRND